jgi:DNA-binding transcriptional LysR family regulator
MRVTDLRAVDLNLLVTLDALLSEGSVTRAAARLGLSAPATSHALARLRETLDDPLLVRAGRGLVRTPRAEALAPEVTRALEQARRVFAPASAPDPATLERTFTVHATDHALAVLGPALDRIAAAEAPGVVLSFLPNRPDDPERLRDGAIDLAIGVYRDLPAQMRRQRLFEDRFVCVVREGHPTVRRRPSLKRFCALEHVLVAPRGRPGSAVDDALRARDLRRRVVRTVPYFLLGLLLVSRTDHVLTISERVARAMAAPLGLRVVRHPLELPRYALHQLWHPRQDADPAHRWLRDAVHRAAREAAPPLR